MGKTISITIPLPLEKELKEGANQAGMSRSRFIGNILLKWQEEKKEKDDTRNLEEIPNNCPNREDDGFCKNFDIVCNAPQAEAVTCVGYPKDTNRGK